MAERLASSGAWRRGAVLAAVVSVYTVFDATATYLLVRFGMQVLWFEFAIAGALLAQFLLVGLWGAFAPHGAVRRNLSAACAVLVGYHALVIGYTATNEWLSVRDSLATYWNGLCCLPILFLAAQMPLWPFRLLQSWRFETRDDRMRAGRLSIRHLLVAMGAVAVALGLTRAMIIDGDAMSELWIPLGIVGGLIALAAGLGALPAVLAVFFVRGLAVPVALAILFAFTIGLNLAVTLLLLPVFDEVLSWGLVVTVTWLPVVATCGVAGPLVLARLAGWRLKRGRPTERPEPERAESSVRRVHKIRMGGAVLILACAVGGCQNPTDAMTRGEISSLSTRWRCSGVVCSS